MKISIVIPIFNEAHSINSFYSELSKVLHQIKAEFEILFIDDGSHDNSVEILKVLMKKDDRIKLIEFSRNFGKEAALTAGIDFANGDALIPIDVDLQDPPELIKKLIKKWQEGFDVVLAKRINRSSDFFLKRITSHFFYRIYNLISKIKIPVDVGDFRLIDKKVIEALKLLPENQRFMKGLFAWIGFKQCTVEYSRNIRIGGHSKFNGTALIRLAIDGILNFSVFPIRLFTYIGILGLLSNIIFSLIVLYRNIIGNEAPEGYTSIILMITFIGSIQILGIGILGEYLGKIFIESKRRPIYVIKR